MPRVARVVAPGLPHHITQRGNNRQDVFFTDEDRRAYMRLLLEESKKHGLKVHGYCLMTNHIHLIAVPSGAASASGGGGGGGGTEALAGALGRTHFRYAQYVNRLHGRSGHLWQNRFFSCTLGESHLMAAMRYVERNPVRAGMVKAPWRYAWSSAAAHCGGADETGLLDLAWWAGFAPPDRWRSMLRAGEDDDVNDGEIRAQTRTGRPLGSDRFIAKLEAKLGRRLRRPPMGRPAGSAESGDERRRRARRRRRK